MEQIDLVKTVRSLDQGTLESVPDKLDRVWKALTSCPGGNFHAAEEVVLRWLLKHMSNTFDNGEKLRRWPLTWSIMACVFQRIPLSSLAKILADRRFIAVLQQTAKDLAKPQSGNQARNDESSDTEMTGAGIPRKRKRRDQAQFDLGILREPPWCQESAEPLFEALRLLLGRVETTALGRLPNDRIGAEHIKSLFCSSSSEAMELLVPLLRICNQATTVTGNRDLDNQDKWISTFLSIWNLHLQGPSDAFDVATHLSPFACVMLDRLSESPEAWSSPLSLTAARAWSGDLERFMTLNLVLPARSAFLNKKDTQALFAAVGMNSNTSRARSTVFFRVALQAGLPIGDATAKTDNEKWIQMVFEMAERPLRTLPPAERNRAIAELLRLAAQHKISPSLASLRTVCRDYALEGGTTDWHLISSAAQCDADAFLLSEGKELLLDVLQRLPSAGPADDGCTPAVAFLVSLAKGFAKGRDFARFLKKWFEALSQCDVANVHKGADGMIWLSVDIRRAIAELLQPSLSVQQLLGFLDWAEAQAGTTVNVAQLVVFDAIANGVDLEEYQGALGTRLFDQLPPITSDSSLPSSLSCLRWRITRNSILWASLEDRRRIWNSVKGALSDVLGHPTFGSIQMFEALQCSVVAALSLEFDEENKLDAQQHAKACFLRLAKELASLDAKGRLSVLEETLRLMEITDTYATDETLQRSKVACLAACVARSLRDWSQFFRQFSELDELSLFLNSLLSLMEAHIAQDASSQALVPLMDAVLASVLRSQNGIGILIGTLAQMLESQRLGQNLSPRQTLATLFLMRISKEAFNRPQRERLLASLFALGGGLKKGPRTGLTIHEYEALLSAMTWIISEPTFYQDMEFLDLVRLGQSLISAVDAIDLWCAMDVVRQFERLTFMTIRQMLSAADERERKYIRELNTEVLTWKAETPSLLLVRLILLDQCRKVYTESQGLSPAALGILDKSTIEKQLAVYTASAISQHISDFTSEADSGNDDSQLLTPLIAMSASKNEALKSDLRSHLLPYLDDIKASCEVLCSRGSKIGWRMRVFLAELFVGGSAAQTDAQLDGLFLEGGDHNAMNKIRRHSPTPFPDVLLRELLNAATDSYSEDLLLSHLQRLIEGLQTGRSNVGQLLAVRQVVKKISKSATNEEGYDLATAHSELAQLLPLAATPTEFGIVAQILVMLLEEKAASMGQWNVEATLASVSTVCLSREIAADVRSAHMTYTQLYRLVEVIIKRHRVRLDGHFHLLTTTLQSMLMYLISHPWSSTGVPANDVRGEKKGGGGWKEHAKRFSRLLELVCEPTVASATRAQQNALISATDAAKRLAGQYMYMVLMAYIKAQLENEVPHGVREALEPGMFSILGITPEPTRFIMNDAMDPSGRAIFKEIHRRWQRFGKWKGV